MNGRKAKLARRAQAASSPSGTRGVRSVRWRLAAALGAGAVISASFVLPDVLDGGEPVRPSAPSGVAVGEGLPRGASVPAFAERDVESGTPITSDTIFDRKTLLFFSEGVMCQACFEQIKGLEAVGATLAKRGIQLVSITPDSPDDLRRARSGFGITTPLISDEDRDMSAAFNTLGKGMHGDTPGHAFALVERGKVRWYRDYWLSPSRSMYVEPAQLLEQIPAGAGTD